MTVYVDNQRARVGRMIMCHMVADGDAELHAMAAAVGVARGWFHRGHYNVCLASRAAAVRLGAQEISKRDAARIRARAECLFDRSEQYRCVGRPCILCPGPRLS